MLGHVCAVLLRGCLVAAGMTVPLMLLVTDEHGQTAIRALPIPLESDIVERNLGERRLGARRRSLYRCRVS